MARNFQELKKFLVQNYPELHGHIHGSNYPAPEFATYAAQIIGLMQMFAVASIFLGDAVWSYVPFMNGVPPSWWSDVKSNPMLAIFGLFFSNSIINSLTTTGAFEIKLDGVLIFSKLETGHFPRGPELMQALKAAGL